FLWLTVRRLDARMGLAGLVTAFGKVASRFPDAKLWLAGKGPELASLSALVAREKISDRVKLLGFVSDDELPLLLNAADCTVMPSLDLEGFGLSTVESLACGTPVLGSDAGATPELLRPLDAEMLFPAGDEQALAVAMEKFMNAPGTLPSRSRCREYAAAHFDWEQVVSGWEEFVIGTTGKAGS
ncbi:MAG TPA: glycosyltransferase, partial [Roseimicrobium sp.]|nr:glycosyltransferase [Roseimicrobium sp.]